MTDENSVYSVIRRLTGHYCLTHFLRESLIGVGIVMKNGIEQDFGFTMHDHDAFIGEISNSRCLLSRRSRANDDEHEALHQSFHIYLVAGLIMAFAQYLSIVGQIRIKNLPGYRRSMRYYSVLRSFTD